MSDAPYFPCTSGIEALANVLAAYSAAWYVVSVEGGSILVRDVRAPEKPRILELHFGPDGRILLFESEDESGNTVCV